MFIDEIEPDLCILCLKPFKHYKRYKFVEKVDIHHIKEVELILNCARCRNVLQKQNEIYKIWKEIKQERTDREWKKFISQE